jgi:hypothetical protein
MASAVRFEAQEFQYTKPKSHIMPKILFLTASAIFFSFVFCYQGSGVGDIQFQELWLGAQK